MHILENKTKKKRLSLRQIEIDTNTDDKTVSEFLAENADPNFKPPYPAKMLKLFDYKGKK